MNEHFENQIKHISSSISDAYNVVTVLNDKRKPNIQCSVKHKQDLMFGNSNPSKDFAKLTTDLKALHQKRPIPRISTCYETQSNKVISNCHLDSNGQSDLVSIMVNAVKFIESLATGKANPEFYKKYNISPIPASSRRDTAKITLWLRPIAYYHSGDDTSIYFEKISLQLVHTTCDTLPSQGSQWDVNTLRRNQSGIIPALVLEILKSVNNCLESLINEVEDLARLCTAYVAYIHSSYSLLKDRKSPTMLMKDDSVTDNSVENSYDVEHGHSTTVKSSINYGVLFVHNGDIDNRLCYPSGMSRAIQSKIPTNRTVREFDVATESLREIWLHDAYIIAPSNVSDRELYQYAMTKQSRRRSLDLSHNHSLTSKELAPQYRDMQDVLIRTNHLNQIQIIRSSSTNEGKTMYFYSPFISSSTNISEQDQRMMAYIDDWRKLMNDAAITERSSLPWYISHIRHKSTEKGSVSRERQSSVEDLLRSFFHDVIREAEIWFKRPIKASEGSGAVDELEELMSRVVIIPNGFCRYRDNIFQCRGIRFELKCFSAYDSKGGMLTFGQQTNQPFPVVPKYFQDFIDIFNFRVQHGFILSKELEEFQEICTAYYFVQHTSVRILKAPSSMPAITGPLAGCILGSNGDLSVNVAVWGSEIDLLLPVLERNEDKPNYGSINLPSTRYEVVYDADVDSRDVLEELHNLPVNVCYVSGTSKESVIETIQNASTKRKLNNLNSWKMLPTYESSKITIAETVDIGPPLEIASNAGKLSAASLTTKSIDGSMASYVYDQNSISTQISLSDAEAATFSDFINKCKIGTYFSPEIFGNNYYSDIDLSLARILHEILRNRPKSTSKRKVYFANEKPKLPRDVEENIIETCKKSNPDYASQRLNENGESYVSEVEILMFMTYITGKCGTEDKCSLVAFIYMTRVIQKTDLLLTSQNWQAVWTSCLIISVKTWKEPPLRTRDLGKLFPEMPVSKLRTWEHEMLKLLDYSVQVDKRTYDNFMSTLKRGFPKFIGSRTKES